YLCLHTMLRLNLYVFIQIPFDGKVGTVKPTYSDTQGGTKKCRYKRSVAFCGVILLEMTLRGAGKSVVISGVSLYAESLYAGFTVYKIRRSVWRSRLKRRVTTSNINTVMYSV